MHLQDLKLQAYLGIKFDEHVKVTFFSYQRINQS